MMPPCKTALKANNKTIGFPLPSLLYRSPFLRVKSVYGNRFVFFSGKQNAGRKLSDIRRIGKAFGFKAECAVFAVDASVFAAHGFQHIARIELYSFRICVDRHRPPRFGIAQFRYADNFLCRFGNSAPSVFFVVDSRDKAVVVARPRFFNIASDSFFF